VIRKSLFIKKRILSYGLIAAVVFLVFFRYSYTRSAAEYYFNNAVNTDPAEPGNYWDDAGLTSPAGFVPDSTSLKVNIVAGATYNGNATFINNTYNDGTVTGNASFHAHSQNNGTVTGDASFDDTGAINNAGALVSGTATFTNSSINEGTVYNGIFNNDTTNNAGALVSGTATFNNTSTNEGTVYNGIFNDGTANNAGALVSGTATFNYSSTNNGTVAGDAIFYEGSSQNYGTITGTKTRYFVAAAGSASFDFVTSGPWIVVADGVEVSLSDATIDNTTTLTTYRGGSFYNRLLNSAYYNDNIITLTYNGLLNTSSIPATGDFAVTVNGIATTVTNVSVVGSTVKVTIGHVNPNDSIILSYTPGINPIKGTPFNLEALSFTNQGAKIIIPAGSFPFGSTVVGTKIYVSNEQSHDVTVIDTMTDTAIATISVGGSPEFSTNVSGKVYVPISEGGNVKVISSVTDTVIATIPVGNNPFYATAVGNRVYVTNQTSNNVSVIDTETDTVEAIIPVGVGPHTSAVLGGKVYVANYLANTVSVIDIATQTVTATLTVGAGPRYTTVLGSKVYIVNNSGNTVSVINSLDNSVTNVTVGSQPYQAVAVGNKMYVNSTGSQTLSVINYSTNTVSATVSTSGNPYYIERVGDKVFIDNNNISVIDVLDTATNTIVASRTTDGSPYYFAVVGKKIYTSNTVAGNISIIDTDTSTTASGTYSSGQAINITANFGRTLASGSTMTVALNTGASVVLNNRSGSTLYGTYTVGLGESTPDLSVSAITSASVTDGTHTKTSYALPSSQGNLTAENSFIIRNIGDSKNISIGTYGDVSVGNNPYQISTPVTVNNVKYVYVANQGGDTVSVIRLSDNTIVDTIPVGSEPYGLSTVSVSGTVYVYVANTGSNNVSVIDTSNNTVVATITAGVKPYYVATIGTKVYVTNGASNSVSVINAVTNAVTATISVGLYPRGIKAHGTDLYVANFGDLNYTGGNSISVINSLNNTVTNTIILPAGTYGPRGVSVLGTKVYVANYLSNNVTVIDTADNTVADTIAVGAGPRGITGFSGKVYVENFDAGTISVIDTSNNTVEATITVGHSPAGMSINGTDILISSFQNSKINVLNTILNQLRSALVSAPTPTTSSASSLATTSVTLSSSISSTGNENATTRGFEYGTSTAYGATTSESGLFSTGAFSTNISSLVCGTLYHFRSYVTNTAGTGVSADNTFSTSPCATSGVAPIFPITLPIKSPTSTNIFYTTTIVKPGITDKEVFVLQKYLNTHGFLVSKSGPGSPGKETSKFGAATKAALIKFQNAHKKEILTPYGFTKGTGILGFATKAYINSHQ
jgi:YVTN family beta-propeller protein